MKWTINLNSKTYNVEVIDWIRYIDWQNSSDFVDDMEKKWDWKTICDLAYIWFHAVQNEIRDEAIENLLKK
jgi:hypothetical protein